ncbi:MAG: MFS transporter, partial [Actinomycetota bacterium]|nr:MFS transporter [Actinomycetota bacterium]
PRAAELADGSGVGAVLDPNTLGRLPDAVATGIREGLAAAMHPVFVAGLPIIGIALVATLFIKELPLRTVAFADMESETPTPAGAAANGGGALLRSGLAVTYLSRLVESRRWSSPELLRAASELVEPDGDGSVRERALRANEEVLKPLSRDLLRSYLLESRGSDREKAGGVRR